jgi:DNA-binding transcriptional ArsR family regulator
VLSGGLVNNLNDALAWGLVPLFLAARCASLGKHRPGRGAVPGGMEPAALPRLAVSGTLPKVVTYQADGWSALADPTRRAIVERLAERPWAVGELAATLPVSRPAVSQHLKLLKDVGLVIDRPAGSRRLYQLDPAGLDVLRAELDGFWTKALATYKQIVEADAEESR